MVTERELVHLRIKNRDVEGAEASWPLQAYRGEDSSHEQTSTVAEIAKLIACFSGARIVALANNFLNQCFSICGRNMAKRDEL
jgi:hypothetical protein